MKVGDGMRKIMIIFSLTMLLFTLSGCDLLYLYVRSDIESIQIDEDSLEPYYYIDSFDIESITLIITLDDGSQTTTNLTLSMIHDADRFKLESFGTHSLKVEFRNFETTLTITLYERESLKEKETFLFFFEKTL
jgi:hypothetical protein